MEQSKIPKYLFVIKVHENKVRAYKFIKSLSNQKYLYEDMDKGFKECFLHADITAKKKYQRGYSNSSYKEQERNEKVRIRRRKKGVAYERRFEQFKNKSV